MISGITAERLCPAPAGARRSIAGAVRSAASRWPEHDTPIRLASNSEFVKEGLLPPDCKFKISANVSVANAAAVKSWFDLLGPDDEINPVRDLTLPMMAAMRQVTAQPLDIDVFHRTAVARTMGFRKIVRVAAPVYLERGVLDTATLDPTAGRRHDTSLHPVWWQRA